MPHYRTPKMMWENAEDYRKWFLMKRISNAQIKFETNEEISGSVPFEVSRNRRQSSWLDDKLRIPSEPSFRTFDFCVGLLWNKERFAGDSISTNAETKVTLKAKSTTKHANENSLRTSNCRSTANYFVPGIWRASIESMIGATHWNAPSYLIFSIHLRAKSNVPLESAIMPHPLVRNVSDALNLLWFANEWNGRNEKLLRIQNGMNSPSGYRLQSHPAKSPSRIKWKTMHNLFARMRKPHKNANGERIIIESENEREKNHVAHCTHFPVPFSFATRMIVRLFFSIHSIFALPCAAAAAHSNIDILLIPWTVKYSVPSAEHRALWHNAKLLYTYSQAHFLLHKRMANKTKCKKKNIVELVECVQIERRKSPGKIWF